MILALRGTDLGPTFMYHIGITREWRSLVPRLRTEILQFWSFGNDFP